MISSIRIALIAAIATICLALAPQAQAGFGAIAYAPSSGANGYCYGYASRRDAEYRAMAECGARSGGCQIAIWFQNACGAVASGYRGGWGSAWGNGRAEAEYNALAQCSRYTTNCSIRVWACTD